MGRQESLTAMALGRGHYEDEVIETVGDSSRSSQKYDERGRPRNLETKRKEKENVRAANEVMQVTGVVEDSSAAKAKAYRSVQQKNEETITGLRLMEFGRTVLVGGVWGVMGLRRRVLLYKTYAETGFLNIIRQERAATSIPRMLVAGLPPVVAYHVTDWIAFFIETVVDALFDEEGAGLTERGQQMKSALNIIRNATVCYITLHLRLFAILQQLNLVSSSHLFPSLTSFVPFSSTSPLVMPPPPSLSVGSILSWGSALLKTAAPILIILGYGRFHHAISRIIYRPIYKTLPRPTGDSMFSGLAFSPPSMEYDTPDQADRRAPQRSDEPTLRALEGRSAIGEQNRDDLTDDDEEVTQATLISFDVEATEAVESSLGTWSAELRSANEPKPSDSIAYRVTGLTMLPPIMATEGLREIIAGIILLPLEAVMVRTVGRAYRASAGLGSDDLYAVGPALHGVKNLSSVLTLQLAFTGVFWAGFTIGTQQWAARRRANMADSVADIS